ncbi:heme biosynthesis HemY N-terminal domain-containing protein [Teredinibacter haidensis]|uniref:heme biosynthesis HemY N-terminal domain-containing protein n=1 Tax=Teredinibacter haidensis TaxID=2731755 RepID=UPI000948C9B2|nr:heme biosynthesis HemY N-terminal domain-containing protein [Teredinibacter haidensis]
MKRLLFLGALSLLFLLAGPILVEMIRKDSGYILISVGSTTIEMSFWLAAFPAGLLFTWWLYRFVVHILQYFGFSLRIFSNRRNRQVLIKTQRGLIHFIEGNWKAAKKDLLSVAKRSDQPLVHYLAAARSAYEMGDKEESHRLLTLAKENAPEQALVVLLTQARIQLAEKQYEPCAEALELASESSPLHPTVLDLQGKLYIAQQRWQELVELLPKLKYSKQYSDELLHKMEVQAYVGLLAENNHTESITESSQKAAAVWQSVPRSLRHSPELIAQYAKLLLHAEQQDKAEQLVRQALNKNWDPSLAAIYGTIKTVKPAEQLVHVERWLHQHEDEAQVHLAAARMSMVNELWGKARGYYERSLQLQECPQAYAELAALASQLGDHQKSAALYQKGLLLTTQ